MKKSKKKSKMPLFAGALSFLLGVVSVFMGFLPFVTKVNKIGALNSDPYSLTGFVAAFGASADASSKPSWLSFVEDASFSGKVTYGSKVGILILFILIAAGALLSLFGALLKGKFGKFVSLIGGASMIAGGVMAFFSYQLCGYTNTSDTLTVVYSLGIGAILSGVFASVGGLFSVASGLIGILKK